MTPDILSPEFSENPFPVLELMRNEYPVYFHEAMNSYMISRYEDVERAFKDPAFNSNNYEWQLEPVHGPTILQMEGRDHSRHRNLVTPAFRGADLREKFAPIIERNSAELIEAWRAEGQVDFVQQYTTRFPINVIVDMLGLPKSDHDRFHAWYSSIMAFLSNLIGAPDVMAAGIRTRDELQEYMLPIIAERRSSPGDDLLTTLCQAEIDGERLSDIEVKAFVSLLLTAGGETTDKSMANMFWRLIEHPEQMEAVRADRSLIRNAFAETLRHTPPVQMIMRETATDVEMSGGTIPAGATVTCLLAGANRDPRKLRRPRPLRHLQGGSGHGEGLHGGGQPHLLRLRAALLRRRHPRPHRGGDRDQPTAGRHGTHRLRGWSAHPGRRVHPLAGSHAADLPPGGLTTPTASLNSIGPRNPRRGTKSHPTQERNSNEH